MSKSLGIGHHIGQIRSQLALADYVKTTGDRIMYTLSRGELEDTLLALDHAIHAAKMVGGDSMLSSGLADARRTLAALEAGIDAPKYDRYSDVYVTLRIETED